MKSQFIHHLFLCRTIQVTLHLMCVCVSARGTHTHTSNVCKSIHGWMAETSTIWMWKLYKVMVDAQKRHTIKVTAAKNQKTNECKAYATHALSATAESHFCHSFDVIFRFKTICSFFLHSLLELAKCYYGVCTYAILNARSRRRILKTTKREEKFICASHNRLDYIHGFTCSTKLDLFSPIHSIIRSFPFRRCVARDLCIRNAYMYTCDICMMSVCAICSIRLK